MSKKIFKIIFPVLVFCLFNLTLLVKPVYANNLTPTDDDAIEDSIINHLYIPVDDILINAKELTLPINKTNYELYVEVIPFDAIKSKLTWKSSDNNIVQVDQEGKLTPIKTGTATITATESISQKSVSCKVKIVNHGPDAIINYTDLEFIRNNLELEACSDLNLRFKNTPAAQSIDLKNVKFYSDNEYVASISPLGVIEGTGVGITTVYATNNAGDILTSCKIKVIPAKFDVRYPDARREVRIDSNLYTVAGTGPYHKTLIYKKNTNPSIQFAKIPETVTLMGMKYNVVGVDKHAFDDCPNIKEISLGNEILFKTSSELKSASELKHAVHKALKQY